MDFWRVWGQNRAVIELKIKFGSYPWHFPLFGYFLIGRVFYFLLEMLSQSQSNVVGPKGLSESWYHLSKSKVVLLKFHSASDL